MEVPSTTAGVLAEIRVSVGEVAPVGAVVAVIGDQAGAAAKPQPRAASQHTPAQIPPPLIAAKAAVAATRPFGSPRSRGRAAEITARSVLRGAHAGSQFRPGAIGWRHRGNAIGAAARLRGRNRPYAHARFRAARPHCRARCRRGAARISRAARGGSDRRSGQGALRAGQLRRGAARRHAPHHRGAADASGADHSALLSHHGHRD